MVFTVFFIVFFALSLWLHSISNTLPSVENASYAGVRISKEGNGSVIPIVLKYSVIYTTYLFIGWWVLAVVIFWTLFWV